MWDALLDALLGQVWQWESHVEEVCHILVLSVCMLQFYWAKGIVTQCLHIEVPVFISYLGLS